MTGKTQDEAVAILRNAPAGSTVNLVVSRQEIESPRFPRQIVSKSMKIPFLIVLLNVDSEYVRSKYEKFIVLIVLSDYTTKWSAFRQPKIIIRNY